MSLVFGSPHLLRALLASMVGVTAGSAAEYLFTDLGSLGRSSAAFALNNAGQVVGSSTNAAGETRAVLWSDGEIKDLGTLGGTHSFACGINDHGQIVGSSQTASGVTRAFAYSDGVMIDLGTLGGRPADCSAATDINNAGTIVGYSSSAGGLFHGFSFSGGATVDLGVLPSPYGQGAAWKISADGMAIGQSNDRHNQPHAVMYSAGRLVDLGTLGGPFSFAYGVNEQGDVVGQAYSNHETSCAFVYSGGVMRGLGTLGGPHSSARAINRWGVIVGESSLAGGSGTHAFVYAGGVMTNLNQFAGWQLETAWAINDHGQIAGTAIGRNGERRAYLLTPLLGDAETFASVPRLAHVSVRANLDSGDLPIIVGFTLGGTRFSVEKALLLRGVGPSLREFGVARALAAPAITLLRGSTTLASNDGWRGGFDFARAGAFEFAGDPVADAALTCRLLPGCYALEVSGRREAAGIVMAEIYDATPADALALATPRLLNVAARARVGADENIVIAGFLVTGGPLRLLLRAVGPGLAEFGIGNALTDPVLEVVGPGVDPVPVAANDDWETPLDQNAASADELRSVFGRAGAFPLSAQSADAAIVATFPPGAYALRLYGSSGSGGMALVEIYEVP